MPSCVVIMAEEIVLADHNIPRVPLQVCPLKVNIIIYISYLQSILLRQDELTRLYSQGFLTDITLSTEDGKNFEAHKILLAARYNV